MNFSRRDKTWKALLTELRKFHFSQDESSVISFSTSWNALTPKQCGICSLNLASLCDSIKSNPGEGKNLAIQSQSVFFVGSQLRFLSLLMH